MGLLDLYCGNLVREKHEMKQKDKNGFGKS